MEFQCSYCRHVATATIEAINVCNAWGCRELAHAEHADTWVFTHRRQLEHQFGRLSAEELRVLRHAQEGVLAARKLAGTLALAPAYQR